MKRPIRPILAALLAAVVLAACSHAPPRNPMAEWVASPNHDARRPTLIVVHFTQQDSVQRSLHTLSTRNSQGRVSSHYLIGKDGGLYQLVADEQRAWHAGAGSWRGLTDVNSFSIGIELDNDGVAPFTEPLVQSLLVLLEDLATRWNIPRENVIGHSDMAPTRKVDPGALFPWRRLAEAGFGVWPADDAPAAPEGFDAMRALDHFGYSLDDPSAAVRAFRLRFRGDDRTELDDEDHRILHALTTPGGVWLMRPAAPAAAGAH
ncbi:N-acetylmuramoyl-L-alanine amidase [Luteimonas dalianensis]|uniref:N-acetylmuramoyl-L-alanine amidase n=1 Tax=Luteimonas dalianensis TaxID=1148196 RepID=UPI003BF05E1C